MTFQQVQDDLATVADEHYREDAIFSVPESIEALARRVLALWQQTDIGLEATRAFPMPYGDTFGRARYANLLAAYLFGKE